MKKRKLRRIMKKNDSPQQFRPENSERVNCYGYAMGVGFWLELGKIHYGYCLDYDHLQPKQAEVAFFKDAQSLGLKVKKESRKRLPTPRSEEWLVALYLMQGDFHFIRRNSNGEWCHKQGEEPAELLNCAYPPDRIGTYVYVGTYSVSIKERS